MDTTKALVEIQAAGRATGEPGPGSELVASAQGGLRGREVSQGPGCCIVLQYFMFVCVCVGGFCGFW